MQTSRCLSVLTAMLLSPSFACAEVFPSKAVKIIVPYPPSGASDFLARLIAEKLQLKWGSPVVVENRPGASGNIGLDVVAKSVADGYTLVMTNNVVAINVALFPNLTFDVTRDFAPLGLIGSTPMAVVVNPGVQINSLSELTQHAKRQPGKLNFGSCGLGTPQHLAIELYRAMASVEMWHVPYNGCAQAVTDVIGGQIQVLAATTIQVGPQILAGNLRGLAVTSTRRSATLPDVPTFQEAGIEGYSLDIWFGLMAPAKTPPTIAAQLYQSIRAIVTEPAVASRMRAGGVDELVTTPEEHSRVLATDLEKYKALIADLKLVRPSK